MVARPPEPGNDTDPKPRYFSMSKGGRLSSGAISGPENVK
jgi:hypothetical protein